MIMPPLYISACSCISPQDSFGEEALFDKSYNSTLLQCIEPDFRKYINPVQIRRMSKALKMGFSCAIDCLSKIEGSQPDAIMIGTGKGSMEDTEKFLHSIRTYRETALNATHFIHSTYNQVNGAVALQQKITGYNVTYVHRAFSFEHCLLDAQLHFSEKKSKCVLVGSFDEMTREHFTVKSHWNFWKQEHTFHNVELINSSSEGTIAGEGATFLLLNDTNEHTTICISGIKTIYRPIADDMLEITSNFLNEHGLNIHDMDILISGYNGDIRFKKDYEVVHKLFSNQAIAYTKHLSGEYDTASGFMTWMAHWILKNQQIPEELFSVKQASYPIRNILIYNNYYGVNASLILVQRRD